MLYYLRLNSMPSSLLCSKAKKYTACRFSKQAAILAVFLFVGRYTNIYPKAINVF